MNLFDGLSDFGARTAVISDEGETLDYQELASRADAAEAPLRGTRRLVAIESDNSVASLCAYLGAVRARHPVVLLDAALPDALRRVLLARYRVEAVWAARSRSWEWLRTVSDPPALHPDLAILLSTSGTTGSPKLVRLSLKNLASNAASIASYLGIGPDDRPVTALPMHYSYGLSVIQSHLVAGATLLLTSQSIASRAFWDFSREESATSFSGVPTMYEMLRKLRFEQMTLPSLRTLTQAGGRLAPESTGYFAALAQTRGWRFFVMYGQTEASPRMAYLPPERALAKPGSIGRAIPGGSFQVVDGEGKFVTEPFNEGELIYRGPNVMMGYAEAPEDLALGDVAGGVLPTGDLAYFDEEGFFYVTGRIKRFLKVFGNRISLDEVELFAKATGTHAAATGKDDLLMLAVRKPARPPSEIASEICRQYRLHPSAVRVIEVPEFPTSSAGKIQYPVLLESLLAPVGSTAP
ncbi:MAG: long-chain acyl-CoA synthetase [Burkholderiales bacterium]